MKNTRRKHSDSFKTEVVLEALKVRKTLAELAQEYQLSPAQIHSWKAAFLSNAPLSFGAKHKRAVAADKITDDLFNQIGRLKMENELLKKVEMIPLDNRRVWIQTNHPTFGISEQCRIAPVSRSSFYYQKEADNGKDDEAMKVMGPIYLNDCTLGTRRYVEELKDHGFLLGRDKVRSLMRTMGICAVYREPRTTVIDPAKYKFPYLLRGYQTSRPNEVWSIEISYVIIKQCFI